MKIEYIILFSMENIVTQIMELVVQIGKNYSTIIVTKKKNRN